MNMCPLLVHLRVFCEHLPLPPTQEDSELLYHSCKSHIT